MLLKRLAATAAVVAAGLLSAASASAATTWNFSYSAPGLTASGSFTTAGLALVPEDILSITGVRNGEAISGLVPLGDDGNFSYDNQFTSANPNFTADGLLFTAGTLNYNIYWDTNAYYELVIFPDNSYDLNEVSWSAVQAVPESATVVYMLAGLGLMGAALRRQRIGDRTALRNRG